MSYKTILANAEPARRATHIAAAARLAAAEQAQSARPIPARRPVRPCRIH